MRVCYANRFASDQTAVADQQTLTTLSSVTACRVLRYIANTKNNPKIYINTVPRLFSLDPVW